MSKCLKNCFPPLVVFILVGYSYYSYVIQFCTFFLVSLIKKCVYLAFYHFLLLMFMWSFLQTMCKSHKPIPEEYRLTPNEHSRLLTFSDAEANQIVKKIVHIRKLEIYTCTSNGRIRYCKLCMSIKPDRTHHCNTCEMCILKMDHHCPWVANCIGYANYKQFILMLMYGLIWCIFYVGSVAEFLFIIWKDVQNNLNKLIIAMGLIVAGFTGLLLSILFFYHITLICRNETTIEALRETTFKESNLTFDMGKWYNFTEVFGDNICCWLIPVKSDTSDGHEFRVNNLIG